MAGAVQIPDTEVAQRTSRIFEDVLALSKKSVQWLLPSSEMGLRGVVLRIMLVLVGCMWLRYILNRIAAALAAVDEYVVVVTGLCHLIREQVELITDPMYERIAVLQ